MDEIINLINNVGFNAVCILGLGYFVKYVFDSYKTTVEGLQETLEKNTRIVEKLYEKLAGGDDDERQHGE